jgi:2,4-dienoyl-CoA reductase-like NADH-dependent reductase (Old Yellow Enzyme family)
MEPLCTPIDLSRLILPNRAVMAPMPHRRALGK